MTVKKMKLKDLNFDEELIEIRPINDAYVSKYRQNYCAGAIFPMPIIDKKTNIIVSGNTRVTAMLKQYGEDYKVDVIVKEYETEVDKLFEFASENTRHGHPLSSYSRSCIAMKLIDLDVPVDEIAKLFDVSQVKVDKWFNRVTVVVGKKDEKEFKKTMPIKRGAEILIGKEVTEEQYEDHRKHDRGLPISTQANQILSWLRKEWVDKDNVSTMQLLKALADEIYLYIK